MGEHRLPLAIFFSDACGVTDPETHGCHYSSLSLAEMDPRRGLGPTLSLGKPAPPIYPIWTHKVPAHRCRTRHWFQTFSPIAPWAGIESRGVHVMLDLKESAAGRATSASLRIVAACMLIG